MKSITLTDNEIRKFKDYTNYLHHEDPHQYENIRIKDGKVVLILYNSKKLVYNTNSETVTILNKILENNKINTNSFNKKNTYRNNKYTSYNTNISLKDYTFTIGSDETGKGEWYGPLVITATCTTNEQNIKLREIGVKDSKKLTNNDIKRLYPKIIKTGIMHQTIVLRPFQYNKLYEKFQSENKNLNHMLAHIHTTAIEQLIKELNTKEDILVLIDKFDYKKMNQYLHVNQNIKVIQESNGERYTPVAASSIIAKYNFEKTLDELDKRYKIKLRKIKPKEINKDIITKVAKTHFKNVKPYT